MFMNDGYTEHSGAEWSIDLPSASPQVVETHSESDNYQALLNTVDAARDGLAWGEHDYDIAEEEAV